MLTRGEIKVLPKSLKNKMYILDQTKQTPHQVNELILSDWLALVAWQRHTNTIRYACVLLTYSLKHRHCCVI